MARISWDELTNGGRRRRLRAVAYEALGRFGVTATSLRLIATDTNTVYRVDGPGGPWMLRIGHAGAIEHTLSQVRSEMQVLAHLITEGLRVPQPVRGDDGEYVQEITVPEVPGVRRVVLLGWVHGKILGERVGPERAQGYGDLAARLHGAMATFSPEPDFDILTYDSPHPFEEELVLFTAPKSLLPAPRRRLLESAWQRAEDAIARLQERSAMQVLHGDLHIWNVISDQGDMGAIDFEDLMWGWPVQDIATTLYYVEGEDHYPGFLRGFRKGYEARAEWPDLEDIAAFLMARSLVMCNDVILLEDDPEFELDLPSFFARAERRISGWMD